ncbi:hypothetical protein B0H21DRAFT_477609 [Amylocystis lapponica]|nr:hypothetical protein B0H21DRAFT_477609 [Amylocystis lapponica]
MSLGGADAKFPGQGGTAIPPSPSRENPGQVYPKSDPKAAPSETVPGTGGEHEPRPMNTLGNPYVLNGALEALDRSLGDLISTIQREETSVGSSNDSEALLRKFELWRQEVMDLRAGRTSVDKKAGAGPTSQGGGLFSD